MADDHRFDSLSAAQATPLEVTRLWLEAHGKVDRVDDARLAAVVTMANLEEWGLVNQGLRRLPAGLGALPRLRRLVVRECPALSSLAGLEDLTALTEVVLVDLPKLDLADAVDRLARLPALTTVTLGGDALVALPAALARLRLVDTLTLAGCPNLVLDGAFAALAALPALRALTVRRQSGVAVPLPPSIGLLVELERLELVNDKLTTLPAELGALARLRALILARNQVRALPDAIGRLSALEELDLAWNRGLRKLPPAIGELTRLRRLSIEWTGVTALPAGFARLTRLRDFTASDRLATVPAEVWTNLRFDRVKLPAALAGLAQFAPADAAADTVVIDQVERVAAGLGDPRVLRVRLPAAPTPLVGLGSLGRLEHLELELPRAHLDDAISQLAAAPRLRSLTLHGAVGTLPDALGGLAGLDDLRAGDCQLTAVSAAVGDLTALTKLFLGRNRLAALPPALAALGRLTWLDLSHNPLAEVPRWIGRLTALRRLDLAGVTLSSLPSELAELAQLDELSLTLGRVEAPAVLGALPSLRSLEVARRGPFDWARLFELVAASPIEHLTLRTAQLDTLPPEIGRLTRLRHLDLSFARLARVPRELAALPQLTYLRVCHGDLADGERIREHLGPGWTRTDRGPTISSFGRHLAP